MSTTVLGDTYPFDAWIEEFDPPYRIGTIVEDWILGLEIAPEQVPSILWSRDDDRYRFAVIPGADGVAVVYRVKAGDPGVVDLLWVGADDPSAQDL